MNKKRNSTANKWVSMDLHLHTPSSSDYQDPQASYLDILHRAEAQGLEMIAFTDHNTVAGFRRMHEEIEQLKLLDKLNRMVPDEQLKLKEFERLLGKILILPGFEFTATFGFHILGIFAPDKPIREIEHILLNLNVPSEHLDEGSVTVGASSDVLTAYRQIKEGGGLAIAAHANSTNGIAMRGFAFGGQTKIAYTQDPNLAALEVTDLEQRGRRTTASFFSGIKPEYPRRMHCIQGSDAHRLETDPKKKKNLGIGDRVTEVFLPETSYEALSDLFYSNDFARTRPRRKRKGEPVFDFVLAAREEGSNIVQDFHENMTMRGGNLYGVIADVCAFANTNGGTLYVGVKNDPKAPISGIKNPAQAVRQLEKEISQRINPPLSFTVDVHKSGGKSILRILVSRGTEPPYAVDDQKIYIREEAETGLAVRDEIVGLVSRSQEYVSANKDTQIAPSSKPLTQNHEKTPSKEEESSPKTGVEVVKVNERNGTKYYTVRDLRNGNIVKNVTHKSARRLWHYAITNYDEILSSADNSTFKWKKDLGIIKRYKQGKNIRYDLIQKTLNEPRYFFGVTEEGVHGKWVNLVGQEE